MFLLHDSVQSKSSRLKQRSLQRGARCFCYRMMIAAGPPRREMEPQLLLSRRSGRVFELGPCLAVVAWSSLSPRWPWTSGVAAMRAWGPRTGPGGAPSLVSLVPDLQHDALLSPGRPAVLCSSNRVASLWADKAGTRRRPAAGGPGQVPPPGGRPVHRRMQPPRLQTDAAPRNGAPVSRVL